MIVQQPGNFGDLKTLKVYVNGVDIYDAVSGVTIYQDILTPAWTALILVDDTTNLIMRLPIGVGDEVKIVMESKNESPLDDLKDFHFIIQSMRDRSLDNQGYTSYSLYCVSPVIMTSMHKRISKSYKGTADQIVSTIGSEELGIEVKGLMCLDQMHVIIPNWSPLTAIAWLSMLAVYTSAAEYLFFQSDNGKFTFKPYEWLYRKKEESSNITFVQRTGNIRKGGDYDEDYCVAVSNFSIEHNNFIPAMAGGMYGNTKLSYDMRNKTWTKEEFTYGKDIGRDETYKFWKASMNSPKSNISFLPKHPGMFSFPTYLDHQDIWEPSRKCALQKVNQEKIKIQVPGSVGLWKTIGKNCELELPSHQEIEEEVKLDKYRKGRYVISAIAHIVNKKSYVNTLELIKKRRYKEVEM